tara:strand:+ start:4373 stop:5410 length:1038 start_codon:yes stop_codon:yes gene_type:complete
MAVFYSRGKTILRVLMGGLDLVDRTARSLIKINFDDRQAKIRMPYSKFDTSFVTGEKSNEVEIARFCGDSTVTKITNVSNCFTSKKPRLIVDSDISTHASLKLTFGSMPSNGNQIIFTGNSVTRTINFTNSGGTDTTFSANAADIDITATTNVNAIAAAIEVLFDTLSDYYGSSLSNSVFLNANIIVNTTYDITVGTNTSGATEVITNGKHLELKTADSGALIVFNTRNAMVTLPDSGSRANLGCTFTFLSLTSIGVQGQKIVCTDTANEKIYGAFMAIDTDSSNTLNVYSAQSTDNFSAISWNGTTTGAKNSWVTLTATDTDQWVITGGVLYQTGTPATPFSTS